MTGLARLIGGAGALLPGWAWAQTLPGPDRYDWGHPMMGWGWGWGGMIFGPIFMILVLAVTIAVAVLLVRWIAGPAQGPQHPQGRSPLDILKERYARGEIDKEEYEERRRTLGM
mgnify:CR=1 FL=1